MTPELWQRLKPLYDAALDISEMQRPEFIEGECGGDSNLQRELEALLAANGDATHSMPPLVTLDQFFSGREDILKEGHTILDRFRILRHLGSGGMGDVYEAADLLLEPVHIALKTIRPEIARNPDVLARFKEEVRVARRVAGPNVCRLFELYPPSNTNDRKDIAFITMEFLDGVTLADKIDEDGPLSPDKARILAIQLCEALQSIHRANVVHRDLKTRNIMLVPDGDSERVVVMDFGLARAFAGDSCTASTGLTIPGTVMGTPEYMAPEQFEGREVGPTADIYSLGVVLYEVLTGKHPFAASTLYGAAVRRARQPEPASSIRRGLSPIWDDVIARCLEYEPERRYQSVAAVIRAIHEHPLVLWRFSHGQRIVVTWRLLLLSVLVVSSISVGLYWHHLRLFRPPSPDVAKWYQLGLTALREGTYIKATHALTMAIQLDKSFSLAHARLAEALTELDFTGKAQEEMLLATAHEGSEPLTALDKSYVDAVRSTLLRDYSAAVQDYESILTQLPGDQKASGYVDLGRAYEKAGRIKETINSYEKAAQLMPSDPAPSVHLGIWKSRQRDIKGADAAFSRAEELYQAGSNLEGLAEVAYQRGYAANEEADTVHALEYLNRSLTLAREIPSVQLEVRSLSQLSSVEYNSNAADGDVKAEHYANQAIRLAQENGLEYWVTDGWLRLGNIYMDKSDGYQTAEAYLQRALNASRQNEHPRIEAAALFSIASIRDQQGRHKEQIEFARKALDYYLDYGFTNMAARSSILIVRGEEGEEDYQRALQEGAKLLQLSERADDKLLIENAEESVGSIYFDLEDFPDALIHFEHALSESQLLKENESYQLLHCADVLWHLGRYQKATFMLSLVSAHDRRNEGIQSYLEDVEARMLLSGGHARSALGASEHSLKIHKQLPIVEAVDLLRVEAIGMLQLGDLASARVVSLKLYHLVAQNQSQGLIAQANLVNASFLMRSGQFEDANKAAEDALHYFSSKQQPESECLSSMLVAQSLHLMKKDEQSRNKADEALKILRNMREMWGPPVFDAYIHRPDQVSLKKEVQLLAKK